jgi:tetratricopeptide (TPR) repeat protein
VQELEESLEISRQTGSQSDEAQILGYFGNLAYWQGIYRQARDYFEECIALGEKINLQMSVLWARVNRAYAILKQGDIQQALVKFGNSLRRMQQEGVVIGVVFAIEGLASLYLTVGQPARAARLIAWGDAIREKSGDHRPLAEQKSVDQDLEVIHTQLEEAEFTRLSMEGRAMTIEQAIDFALSETR